MTNKTTTEIYHSIGSHLQADYLILGDSELWALRYLIIVLDGHRIDTNFLNFWGLHD